MVNRADVITWMGLASTQASQRDWIFNECLANDPHYAKTDAEKVLNVWDAEGLSIEIRMVAGLQADHPWLYALFIRDLEARRVRMPWNPADSEAGSSLFPGELPANTTFANNANVIVLSRWSTASRSSLVLVPENPVQTLTQNATWDAERRPAARRGEDCIHQGEWAAGNAATQREYHRFYATVAPHLGAVCSPAGAVINGARARLYSIKTGVSYVGSAYEKPFGKNVLEENSVLAIIRSDVIRRVAARATDAVRDPSFRFQVELLTITANGRIDNQDVRDGFQVRDVSCMRAGESYLPAHAIPFTAGAFSPHAGNAAADLVFWKNNFAIACGRAKARMFLELGLIHMSANAQNYILAFDAAHADTLQAFILRDIGDTSWHDTYVTNVLRLGHPAYANGYNVERAGPQRHLLSATSNPAYPPPRLVRAAAYSVLTHGFADNLRANRGWTHAHVLQLGQAVLDGFRLYFVEAVGYEGAYGTNPADPGLTDQEILQIGNRFMYPKPMPGYTALEIANFTQGRDLLATARWIRHRSAAILLANNTEATVKALINAEEMAICAHIDAFLLGNADAIRARLARLPYVVPGSQETRLRPLTWSGSQSMGLKCGRCKAPHQSRVSLVMGRWHRCTICHTPYCNTCAKWHLSRNQWFTRTRACAVCHGETMLVE